MDMDERDVGANLGYGGAAERYPSLIPGGFRISGPMGGATWPGRYFKNPDAAMRWAETKYATVQRVPNMEHKYRWILHVTIKKEGENAGNK